jgi:hypothetical protein
MSKIIVSKEEQARLDDSNIYRVIDRLLAEGKLTAEEHEKVDMTPRTETARRMVNHFLASKGFDPIEFEDIVL